MMEAGRADAGLAGSSARSTAGSRSTQPNPAFYKTVICRYWGTGDCRYGARCAFAHGADELRVRLAHCPAAVHANIDGQQPTPGIKTCMHQTLSYTVVRDGGFKPNSYAKHPAKVA